MKRYDLALVGCGGVSRMHLEGYRRHPDRLRVVAACDPDPERLENCRREHGIERGFPSPEAMVEDSNWDVAVVCTPTSIREAVVRTLASAGKPIFVEKPLADTYEEARRIVEACRIHSVPLAVDQNFRYHYPFDTARQIIGEARLGTVHTVLHQDLMFRQDQGWRVEQPRHALSVMGIHWLDGFRWMLGTEAASVSCRTYASPAI
ncbi:MAG: Gfo/Idh/MocA family oxidoreductase, partial [Armatimonadetes bacterium]|nr:Gfo/Idh/MocA family oxidoreductase [Armatimonadota bacterium]